MSMDHRLDAGGKTEGTQVERVPGQGKALGPGSYHQDPNPDRESEPGHGAFTAARFKHRGLASTPPGGSPRELPRGG